MAIINEAAGPEPVCHAFKDMTEDDIAGLFADVPAQPFEYFAMLEKVHSMPKQGVASSFKFGEHFGILKGILAARKISREYVTPQKWQKEMSCLTGGDKNISKAAAQRLFPTLKVTHAIADALLLAEYCRRILNIRNKK